MTDPDEVEMRRLAPNSYAIVDKIDASDDAGLDAGELIMDVIRVVAVLEARLNGG